MAQKMTSEKWRYLHRNTDTEFVVNEALAEIRDPRLTGEVNWFRGLTDVNNTLDKLMHEATQQVNEIIREAVVVETELQHCCKHLELADAMEEISNRFRRSHPLPIPPCTHSPECTPLPPHMCGPNEMPMLAGDNHHHCQNTPKCYRCHSPSHLVSVCPKSRKHQSTAKPPAKRARTNSVEEGEWVEPPSAFQQAAQNESMMLMECIGLLERMEWTPEVCAKCVTSRSICTCLCFD